MSTAPPADQGVHAVEVEAWLAELGCVPLERADREDVTSWDLILDGRRRFDLRITLIWDPSVALIVWAHFGPPIADAFRRSYRTLLRWNDELPFAKFSLVEDERPALSVELPAHRLDGGVPGRDALGLALARVLAIADRLLDESVGWLAAAGWSWEASGRTSRGAHLLERYAAELGELLDASAGAAG